METNSPATRIDTPNVVNCSGCPELVSSRTRIVNGTGPETADILFVGEAPGKNEDEQGEPFVGRSGGILDETLETVGLERAEVRITNLVRCRPEDNRDPRQEEIENCRPHLELEVQHVEPSVIVPLGAFPAEAIISEEINQITKVTGEVFETPLGRDETVSVASVHPAATIYNRDLRPAFEDTLETVTQLV